MKQEAAETLALKALGWLASQEDLMPVFLGSTGASIDDVKSRASEAEFLGSVLDFLLMDDRWVLDFATCEGIRPESVMTARQGLPGGESRHWT